MNTAAAGRPWKQPHSVLVVIHTPEMQILLLERAAHAGYWQSVTGSREAGETSMATALREVEEETGIKATADNMVDWRITNRYEIFQEWRHRYAPGVSTNEESVFSLCVPENTPIRIAPEEHRQYRWLPWQTAAEHCFSWSNRDAIHLLSKHFIPKPGLNFE